MRTYEAIDKIGQKIIEDGFCDAIILKGSIGRGDDDAYSDVDMYLVVKENCLEKVMEQRLNYLGSYRKIVYLSDINFGLPQKVTIYDNGLHVDLYAATYDQLDHSDPVKVYYDPTGLFKDYHAKRKEMPASELVGYFNSALYCFTEADTAFQRKNMAWASRIMDESIASTAVLLRYQYDKKYAFLGLKKLNEIIPMEQYLWLEQAYQNLGKDGFVKTNEYIIKALDYFVASAEEEVKSQLDLALFDWVKQSIGTVLFRQE